jgi:hypothetical protein
MFFVFEGANIIITLTSDPEGGEDSSLNPKNENFFLMVSSYVFVQNFGKNIGGQKHKTKKT